MNASIEEYIQIDKRIDAAEEQGFRESLCERWEFGKRMLVERVKSQNRGRPGVPKARMDELVEATGKCRRELQYRMRFTEQYPTEENLCTAMHKFESWMEVKTSFAKPGERQRKSQQLTPQLEAEVNELVESGHPVSRKELADKYGVGEMTVRIAYERARGRLDALENEATVIDWATVTGKWKDREAVMRRQIRRELEAEFQPRVQAGVDECLRGVAKDIERMRSDIRCLRNAQRGILTRDEYNLIRGCLHPDSRLSVTDEKLAKAFRIFNGIEIVFLNENDCPTTRLPSLEELLNRRRGNNV